MELEKINEELTKIKTTIHLTQPHTHNPLHIIKNIFYVFDKNVFSYSFLEPAIR